ncbi:MAG: glycosyltransferase family 39 protein [Vicinamibacterales bacterium]
MSRGQRRGCWVLAGVVACAVGLRSIGLGYGLPAVYNPDEIAILTRALSLGQTGLDPRNFLYPSLYFYALFVWEGLWFVVGRLLGIFGSLSAFERTFFVDPSSLYMAGRVLTVICGSATVIGVYRLTTSLFSRAGGVAAALLLATSPLAVRDAHYVKHDVPVTLLIVLTHVVLARDLMTRPQAARRRPWLAGILTGLALSTHYYAVFLALPVAFVQLTPLAHGEPMRPRLRRLLAAGLAAAAAFALTSPFLMMEPARAWQDIVENRRIVIDRATSHAGPFGSLGFYLTWLWEDATSRMTSVLALAGCGVALWRRGPALALTLVFPLAFLAFIANTVPASRYLNPVVPFVCVLAGAAVSMLVAKGHTAGRLATAVVVAAALAEAGVASVRTDLFFRQTDTRTLARQWIEAELPEGTSILVQPYSVPLRPSVAALREALTAHLGSPDRATPKFKRQLELDPYPTPAYRTLYLGDGGMDPEKIYVSPSEFLTRGLEPLRERTVTHVVLKQYNVQDPAMRPLLEALQREGRLVARFSPYRPNIVWTEFVATAPFVHNTDARVAPALERPGPIIEIWTIH